MKLIRPFKAAAGNAGCAFLMSKQEVSCFQAVLLRYPLLKDDYHKLTHGSVKEIKAEQETLQSAMAQQREEHKRKLEKFFASPTRFRQEAPGQFRLALTAEQLEWMLQVLNDVRVGCWVKLGRPELGAANARKLSAPETRDMTTLELCGIFRMALLQAVNGPAT